MKSREIQGSYPFVTSIQTRWDDNDLFNHVNNVVYHSYIQATVACFLMRKARVNWTKDPVYPVAAETGCRFHHSLAYPEVVDAGLRVSHIGQSSIVYEIALFSRRTQEPAATGHFVHVFVDRRMGVPVPIPEKVKVILEDYRRVKKVLGRESNQI